MNRKIGLSQTYNLGAQHYQSYFMFDLVKRQAKLISQGVTEDSRKHLMNNCVENEEIAKSFIIPNKFFNLSKKECNRINLEYEKLKHVYDKGTPGIWSLSHIAVNAEYASDDIKWYNYEYSNMFPNSWMEFAEVLIDILGFDLLNVHQKKLITELHYDIKPDGVYDKKNSKKLKLKKVNYHISHIKQPYNMFNYTISEEDSNFKKISELLEYFGVYQWYHEKASDNILKHNDFNDFDGNSWFLELIFEEGKVLNLRGDNAVPDTYIHLGNELLKITNKDYLRVGELKNKEFLKSFGMEKLANKRYTIEKIEINYELNFAFTLHNKFTIDCKNNIIIPDKKYNIDFNHGRDLDIYKSALKNVPTKEFKLDSNKLTKFLNDFKNLKLDKLDKSNNDLSLLKRTLENSIEVTFPSGSETYDFKNNPMMWISLGKMLQELVGFDILNLENSKRLITNLHYDFRRDGVYDKKTSKKLRLKSLYYGNGAVLHWGYKSHRIKIDFENKKISGCINEDNVSDEKLNKIYKILEKYHIYQLYDEKYWQKKIYHERAVFDGYEWSLELVFEGDKDWIIGTSNEFPDIFIHLASEIIDLTGVDILNIDSAGKYEFKLYKQYGDKILKGDEK